MVFVKKFVDITHGKLKSGLSLFINKVGVSVFCLMCTFSILMEDFLVHIFSIDDHTYMSYFVVPGFIITLLLLNIMSFLLSDIKRIRRFFIFFLVMTAIRYGLSHTSLCEPNNDTFIKQASDKLAQCLNRKMKYEVQATIQQNSVNALQVGIYSQLALPVVPTVGWEIFLKNPEAFIKFTPQRVAAFAIVSSGVLALVREGQIGRLYDTKSNILTEDALEKKYEFLINLLLDKPGLDLSTDLINNIHRYSECQIKRAVESAQLISDMELIDKTVVIMTTPGIFPG